MPETPERGAPAPGTPGRVKGRWVRVPSLNDQVEVTSQPLHHRECPSPRFWEERAGPGWFGPDSNQLLRSPVVPAPVSLLKGRGISGSPPPPPVGSGAHKASYDLH